MPTNDYCEPRLASNGSITYEHRWELRELAHSEVERVTVGHGTIHGTAPFQATRVELPPTVVLYCHHCGRLR